MNVLCIYRHLACFFKSTVKKEMETIQDVVLLVRHLEAQGKGADDLMPRLLKHAETFDDVTVARLSSLYKTYGSRNDECGYAINSVWAAIVHRHQQTTFVAVSHPDIWNWLFTSVRSVRQRIHVIWMWLKRV